MAEDQGTDGSTRADEPTALKFVGPATAAVIESAPFDVTAIRKRRVSYRQLVEAGVNPGVAAKLRREFSLVWTYVWEPGADLHRRAAHVTGLDREQRDWVASSGSAGPRLSSGSVDGLADAERAWRDRAAWLTAAEGEDRTTTCPRCEGTLRRFELGDRRSIQCEACGYVGLSTDMGPTRGSGSREDWAEAVARFDRPGGE